MSNEGVWNKPVREGSLVDFDYTNHRGVQARRTVLVKSFGFARHPEYYPEATFVLIGHCLDKGAFRWFETAKIRKLQVVSF